MEYHFYADCLVEDCLCHFTTEANNWEDAYTKAYGTALKSSIMDSGSVDFDFEYYKSKSFIDNNAKMIDFVMSDKESFLETYNTVTEEEYFATKLMLQKYFMDKYENERR